MAVLACKDDRGLFNAVKRFEGQLEEPRSLLRVANFEDIISDADNIPALAGWAAAFRQRYLDLTPVTGA